MTQLNKSFLTSGLLTLIVFASCSQSSFNGDSKKAAQSSPGIRQSPGVGQQYPNGSPGVPGTPGQPTITQVPSPSPSPSDGLDSNGGGQQINVNVQCSIGKVAFIVSNNPAESACPANSTAYAADDGSALSMACCALPATDIFLPNVQPHVNGTECGLDELVVGASGNSVICAKIDTTKYKLAMPAKACYYGSGASGKSGAGPCGAPNPLLSAIGGRFGSDGCIAPPGSVVHGRSGKNCGSIPIYQIQTINGVPLNFPY